MHTRVAVPHSILRLALQRQGIVCRDDLLAAGLSRHVIARMTREWATVARGVYAIPGNHDAWLQRVFAALAIGGAGAAAWGSTALALWGLGDRPPIVEITTGRTRIAPTSWMRVRRDDRGLRRIIELDPPRVCLEDAVIDAASSGLRIDALAVVSRALQERRTTPERLLAILRGRSRIRHRHLLLTAIGDSASGAHSALEHLYLRDVERAHGLPPMARQFTVPQTGHVSDGAYCDNNVLIELDGVRYHDRDADRALDHLHGTYGHRTFRFEWPQVDGDPCSAARTIGTAIGFTALRQCRRCPT